ncbi:MAG: carbohydrate-binding family 9-like protein [Bacteroidota bacterium]|nr:carbohydrate-binding family 9-like protein [Bacteroidota bacterium]
MKNLIIRYIEALNDTDVESAGEILENFGVLDTIEILNWAKEYPYRPITQFNIARSYDSLFIKFSVRGSMLRAIYLNDQEPVNEDSCVEFFCKLPGNDKYMNFEFNCIGTCKAAKRVERNKEVTPYSKEELSMIKRFSTLGRRAFNELEGMFNWELTVKIPMRIMGIDPVNLPEKILGNFYKCADGTDSRHFVTWSPVKTDKPDFHRTEFFGELYF